MLEIFYFAIHTINCLKVFSTRQKDKREKDQRVFIGGGFCYEHNYKNFTVFSNFNIKPADQCAVLTRKVRL